MKIKLSAKIENLGKLLQFVSAFAEEKNFPREKINKLVLSTEEALINICNYAYPENPGGEVEVVCSLKKGGLVIKILDKGVPFDVESHSDPDVSATITERKIGGLGIFLIRNMMDEVKYCRENGHNILILSLKK